MSAYTPQQAWSVAYSDTMVKHCGSDETFTNLRSEIKERAKILDKSLRVKIAAWLAKLSEDTRNDVWKKNRNAYAKLLLQQLKCGRLEEPFNTNPGTAPLPTLNKSFLYPFTKPKTTSNISHSSSISKPQKLKMTPSQLLDSYLSYHGEAASGAAPPPPPSPIPIGCLDSLNTPTSRVINPDLNQQHLNTAASHINQHNPVAVESSGDDAAAAAEVALEPIDGRIAAAATGAVELCLNEAEERLRQHSALLSLFLDISSSDHQLQQLEMRKNEEQSQQPSFGSTRRQQQQKVKSVAEVLDRAERVGKQEKDGNASKNSTLPKLNAATSLSRLHKEPLLSMNNVSENFLEERLTHFEEETAMLKAKMAASPAHSSSFSFSIGNAHHSSSGSGDTSARIAANLIKDKEKTTLQNKPNVHSTSFDKTKSKNVSFIPARHTLKSAAAAEATRKSLETDEAEDGFGTENNFREDTKKDFDKHSNTNTIFNLHKAAALLKPRPGSTTALISEVAALRKRVASNLACIEESQKDKNYLGYCGVCGGGDEYLKFSTSNGGGGVDNYSDML